MSLLITNVLASSCMDTKPCVTSIYSVHSLYENIYIVLWYYVWEFVLPLNGCIATGQSSIQRLSKYYISVQGPFKEVI